MSVSAQDPNKDWDEDEIDPDDFEPELIMTPDSLGGSASTRSRDEALVSVLPIFMIHRQFFRHDLAQRTATLLHQTSANSLSLGLVVTLPEQTPANAAQDLSAAHESSLLIADPACYAMDIFWGPQLFIEKNGVKPKPPGGKASPVMSKARHWPYFQQTLTGGATQRWVASVVEAQRQVGANLILSPGVPLDELNPVQSLLALEQEVDWTQSQLNAGEQMAVNITARSVWLTNSALRGRLLSELVQSRQHVWYLRIQWPNPASTYGQLLVPAVLDGYKELCRVASEEGKTLLLPRTGGTGWLSLAWGSSGFGTGLGSKVRAFTIGKFIPAGGAGRTNRYFERRLLHTITKSTEDSLARLPGFVSCQCIFCQEQRGRLTWDANLSGAHYTLRVGELTASIAAASGPARLRLIRQEVTAAQAYANAVRSIVPLVGADDPAHLPLWLTRL